MRDFYFSNKKITERFVKDKDTSIANYIRYMLARTQSIFHYEGLPDSIPQRMLELHIQVNGYTGIAKYEDKLYSFYGGLGGEPDEYYRPSIYTVSNPKLGFSKNYKIVYETNKEDFNDEDSVIIIPNDSMYLGLMPLNYKYSSLLTENDITLRIADINLRLVALISAGDDKTKTAAMEYLKEIEKGNLGILADNTFLESLRVIPTNNASFSNYLSQLIEYEQYLKANWYHDIGLNSNYNMKRETINDAEAGLNDSILLPFIDNMLGERRKAIDLVNELFNTNISIDLDSSWKVINEEVNNPETFENKEGELEDEPEVNLEKEESNNGIEET